MLPRSMSGHKPFLSITMKISTCLSSSTRYKGYFLNGMRNGQGIEIFHNGERYIGEYAADKQNGLGTSYYANGNIKYMGTWLNGTPHG